MPRLRRRHLRGGGRRGRRHIASQRRDGVELSALRTGHAREAPAGGQGVRSRRHRLPPVSDHRLPHLPDHRHRHAGHHRRPIGRSGPTLAVHDPRQAGREDRQTGRPPRPRRGAPHQGLRPRPLRRDRRIRRGHGRNPRPGLQHHRDRVRQTPRRTGRHGLRRRSAQPRPTPRRRGGRPGRRRQPAGLHLRQ